MYNELLLMFRPKKNRQLSVIRKKKEKKMFNRRLFLQRKIQTNPAAAKEKKKGREKRYIRNVTKRKC